MSIRFQCDCGRSLRAPDEAVGRRGRCPACGAIFTVPATAAAPVVAEPPPPSFLAPDNFGEYEFKDVPAPAKPRPRPAVTAAATVGYASSVAPQPVVPIPTAKSTGRPYRYLVLLVALVPLAWATVVPGDRQTFEQRFVQTIEHHPEVGDALDQLRQDGHEIGRAHV